MRHIDAGKLGAQLLLGDRAHCLAGVGETHDEPQHKRHRDHDGEADDTRQRQESRPHFNDIEGVGQVDGAGVGAERVEERVLDHDREPERHQQDVAVLAVGGRPDHEPLQGIADKKEQGRQEHRRDVRVDPEKAVREEGREHRGGEQRPMREVDDVQHAVDQREAERDQRIDGARHQAVEQRRDEDGR